MVACAWRGLMAWMTVKAMQGCVQLMKCDQEIAVPQAEQLTLLRLPMAGVGGFNIRTRPYVIEGIVLPERHTFARAHGHVP